MAQRFGVTPGQIENEEDTLLYCALEGMAILDAYRAKDRFQETRDLSALSPAQMKLIKSVEDTLANLEKPQPEFEGSLTPEELAQLKGR